MSTSSKNISAKRIARLVATGECLFHTTDLAVLFGISNLNTLRVTLHRLTDAGILYRIQRGLYSILPPEQIDPLLLGAGFLHRFCILTAESVLRDEGYILQSSDTITFASSVSRRFSLLGHRYICRRLHPRFLHNHIGIAEDNGIFRATAERAIADLLYIDPWYHFDHPVDWKAVQTMQKNIGYPLTPHRYVDSLPQ